VVAEAHPDILGVCELASLEALADLRERLAERGIVAGGVDAANVAGGTMAWIDSGRDVATGSEPG
jgi:hypothetical protein